MSSIDERVVEMTFKNSQFQKGIKDTTDSLDNLKESLKLDGATSGLELVQNAASNFSLENIESSVANVSSKFGAFGAIGFSVLQKLTQDAMVMGKEMADFIWQPLVEGGKNRSLNLQQARFQFNNLGLDVKAMMEAVSNSVDNTAYSLDQAAVAASSFAASGVGLDRMQHVLTSVAGTAAISGAEYSRVADIFTKVAGQGRLMGDDLNRFSALGLNIAAELAKQWGTTEGAIRELASEGKISFDQLADATNNAFGASSTKSNELYTGSLANLRSAISRIGASYFDGIDPMNQTTGILMQQRDIFNAIRPVINLVHTALKPLIQLMIDAAGVRADAIIKFFNALEASKLEDFTAGMAGFTQGLRNIFDFLGQLKGAFTDAFSAVFTPTNSQILTNLGNGFADLTSKLKLSDKAVGILKTGFTVFMSVIKFVWETLKALGSIIWEIMGLFAPLAEQIGGVFGDLFASFQGLNDFDGDGTATILEFFTKLGEFRDSKVQPIIDFIRNLREHLEDFLESADIGAKVTKIIDWFKDLGSNIGGVSIPLEEYGANIEKYWVEIKAFFVGLKEFLTPIFTAIKDFILDTDKTFKDLFGDITQDDVLAALNVAALITVGVVLYKQFKQVLGLIDAAKNVLNSYSNLMHTISARIAESKSDIFLKIAVSIAILAGSLWLLSTIEPEKLLASMIAIVALVGLLLVTMKIVDKFDEKSLAKLNTVAASLVVLSAAIGILAASLWLLGQLSLEQMGTALIGLAAALIALVGGMIAITRLSGDITKVAGQLFILAVALALMAGAVWLFAQMDWDTMLRGMAGLGMALGGMVASMVLMSLFAKDSGKAAVGMLAMATALVILAGAVYFFGTMKPEVIQQGLEVLAVIAIGMLLFAAAMQQMAPKAMAAAAGMLLMVTALMLLVPVIQILGMMDPAVLAQGLITIAASLIIFAIAAYIMQEKLAGATGILVISAALLILAIAIRVLAEIPFEAALGGLLLLAAGIFILVGAATMAQGLTVGFTTLAVVILAIGAAMLLAGLGVIAFAMGIALLGPALWSAAWGIERMAIVAEAISDKIDDLYNVSGALAVFGLAAIVAGVGAVILGVGLLLMGAGLALISSVAYIGVSALQHLVEAVVELSDQGVTLGLMGLAFGVLGTGLLVAGVGAITLGLGLITVATGILMVSMAMMMLSSIPNPQAVLDFITGLINLIPVFLEAVGRGLVAVAEIIRANAEVIVSAFLSLVNEFLIGMQETIPLFVEAVVLLLSELIQGIITLIPQIVEAGVLLITELLLAIQELVPLIIDTAVVIITALVEGLVVLIPLLVDAGLRMLTGILDGIANNIDGVVTAATDVIVALVTSIGDNLFRIVEAGGNTILKFITSMTEYIDNNYKKFSDEGVRMVNAIAEGIGYGIGNIDLWALGQSFMSGLIGGMESEAEINSPSKRAIQMMSYIADGLSIGADKNSTRVEKTGKQLAGDVISGMKSAISRAASVLDSEMDMTPTIRPVLDLSDVRKEAGSLTSLLAPPRISAARSYNQVNSIDAEYKALLAQQQAVADAPKEEAATNLNFTQNINSPKALSAAEVYRQTRNQLSVAKGELENAK